MTPVQENSCLKVPQMSKTLVLKKQLNCIRILTTTSHKVKVNFGILTTVHIFQSVLMCFIR